LSEVAESKAREIDRNFKLVVNELSDIKQSKSWRVTAPLREVSTFVRKLQRLGKLQFYKNRGMRLLRWASRLLKGSPIVFRILRFVSTKIGLTSLIARRLPGLLETSARPAESYPGYGLESRVADLSPRGKAFYSKIVMGDNFTNI
jgi:hypothetical protein